MTIEEEVLAVGETWDAALVANDAAAFTEFVTEDWVYIDSKGATTRAVLVGWIRTGRLVHHTMRTVGEPRVAIHGDTAIVTARKASSGTWDGVAYTADEWITAVFVREGERWLCALSQKSPVER